MHHPLRSAAATAPPRPLPPTTATTSGTARSSAVVMPRCARPGRAPAPPRRGGRARSRTRRPPHPPRPPRPAGRPAAREPARSRCLPRPDRDHRPVSEAKRSVVSRTCASARAAAGRSRDSPTTIGACRSCRSAPSARPPRGPAPASSRPGPARAPCRPPGPRRPRPAAAARRPSGAGCGPRRPRARPPLDEVPARPRPPGEGVEPRRVVGCLGQPQHDRLAAAEPLGELQRQVDVHVGRGAHLDVHHPAAHRVLQQARHLEARQPQLVGDRALRRARPVERAPPRSATCSPPGWAVVVPARGLLGVRRSSVLVGRACRDTRGPPA